MSITHIAPQRDDRDPVALVAANVREVMGRQMKTQADMARWFGLSRSGASKRWRGITPFTLHDLGVLSQELGVPLTRFMQEGDDERARRDSNSQPSDPKSDVSDAETPYGTVVPLHTHHPRPVLTLVRGRAS